MHKNELSKLKVQFSSRPILKQPIRGRPFQLHTNWIVLGLGVVFPQLDEENSKFVVACASQSNNQIETKYNSYEGECMVV